MNVLFCFYRDWAEKIYHYVAHTLNTENSSINLSYVKSDEELDKLDINKYNLIFFIGWSTIIKDDIINSVPCVCLHPSKLPKYRGGSPIQNQILNGEKEGFVTLFLMDSGIDTGDVLKQFPVSLEGDLEHIFSSISNNSYLPIVSLIREFSQNHKFINRTKQVESESSFFKRRTKKMSEIIIEDFKNYTAEELYNKIRCLQDPYPNAFIKCKNDTILYLVKSKIDKT